MKWIFTGFAFPTGRWERDTKANKIPGLVKLGNFFFCKKSTKNTKKHEGLDSPYRSQNILSHRIRKKIICGNMFSFFPSWVLAQFVIPVPCQARGKLQRVKDSTWRESKYFFFAPEWMPTFPQGMETV
jgi:hypothetical protein